jgi:hypothetical protein
MAQIVNLVKRQRMGILDSLAGEKQHELPILYQIFMKYWVIFQ